jgi:formylmethanofuran dehydrogenase subunit D
VEICREDADRLGVKEGDEMEVASRRGTVRGPGRIADIPPGTVFLPFHYGYWDEKDGHHRAANELTISCWDPVSKQPYYKTAAVQVRKAGALAALGGKVMDVTSKALHQARSTADHLLGGTHPAPRSHVPEAIGFFRCGLEQLAQACRSLRTIHFKELELVGCWETFARWCEELHERFAPFAQKYGDHPAKDPSALRQALFPDARPGEFGEMRDLQSLEVLATAVHGGNTLLLQAAQGLRDRQMLDATLYAEEQLRRMLAWLLNQVKHRAVHSLIVPM